MTHYSLFAGCAPGLEPLLHREVAGLGGRDAKLVEGGVRVDADAPLLAELCLGLGVASTLRARVGGDRVRDFATLVKKTAAIPFEAYGAGERSTIRVTSRRSRLFHTEAIEERVREGLARRSSAGRGTVVHVRLHHDRLVWSVDAAGTPLHARGYRRATAKAPLREDLAFALVRLSGWNRDAPLVDPFCGSGTVVAEAARWAAGRPPGQNRTFACEAWAGVGTAFAAARAAAEERPVPPVPPLYASDRDAGAIEAARANLERAGMLRYVHLTQASLRAAPGLTAGREPRGAWASNPPHGGRIGRPERLVSLYQAVGRRFTELGPGWRLALLAADRRLVYRTAVPLTSAAMTTHGGRKVWVMVSPRYRSGLT